MEAIRCHEEKGVGVVGRHDGRESGRDVGETGDWEEEVVYCVRSGAAGKT